MATRKVGHITQHNPASPTAEEWELAVIQDAVYFTAFVRPGPHHRVRHEFHIEAPKLPAQRRHAYQNALAKGAMLKAEYLIEPLIYAVNYDGRSALVTPALAKEAGLGHATGSAGGRAVSGKIMFVASDCGCDYGEARQCELHAGFEPEEREIVCEACNGDRVFWWEGRFDCGYVDCRHCGGKGRVTVTVEPITMEDLEDER